MNNQTATNRPPMLRNHSKASIIPYCLSCISIFALGWGIFLHFIPVDWNVLWFSCILVLWFFISYGNMVGAYADYN